MPVDFCDEQTFLEYLESSTEIKKLENQRKYLNKAWLIVMMIYDADEGYFNDYDKENILLNRLGKAILCI